jgi:hypothetical protein
MIKKSAYISPLTEIVKLNLMIPIQQDGFEVNGSQENEHAWAREHGSFFDEDEVDDGGYKKFQLWDSADSN